MRARRSPAPVVLIVLLLVPACWAVKKAPPNLAGVWTINREKSTGPSALKAPSQVVITQSGDAVSFEYFFGERRSGSETFVADGTERNRYSTRIERAYSRAQWGKDTLQITTRHFLDALGYQSYAESDGWVVSQDRKALTNRLSDGSVVVYEKRAPEPAGPAGAGDPNAMREFHALGAISGDGACSGTGFGGTLRGDLIGSGRLTLCGISSRRQQVGTCATESGLLTFTEDDSISSFTATVIGQLCTSAGGATFLGTYEIDPRSVTGKFTGRISGGSGRLEYSNTSKSISLQGTLLEN